MCINSSILSIFTIVKKENLLFTALFEVNADGDAIQIEHIFDEFYKADSSRYDFDSSGLGLPLCKRIMKRHNGLIWVRSASVGQGSTFYLRFLLKKPLSMKSGKYSYQDIIDRIDKITINH